MESWREMERSEECEAIAQLDEVSVRSRVRLRSLQYSADIPAAPLILRPPGGQAAFSRLWANGDRSRSLCTLFSSEVFSWGYADSSAASEVHKAADVVEVLPPRPVVSLNLGRLPR